MGRKTIACLLLLLLCPLWALGEGVYFPEVQATLEVPEDTATLAWQEPDLRQVALYRADGLELSLSYHLLPEEWGGIQLSQLDTHAMQRLVQDCGGWWMPEKIRYDAGEELLVLESPGLYGLLALRRDVGVCLLISRESGALQPGDLAAMEGLRPAFDAAIAGGSGGGDFVFSLGRMLTVPGGYTLSAIENDQFSGVALRDEDDGRHLEIGYLPGVAPHRDFASMTEAEISAFAHLAVDDAYGNVVAQYQPAEDYIRLRIGDSVRGGLRMDGDRLLGVSMESMGTDPLTAADFALLRGVMAQMGFFSGVEATPAAAPAGEKTVTLPFLGEDLILPQGYAFQVYSDDWYDGVDIQDESGNLTYVFTRDALEGAELDFSQMSESLMRTLVASRLELVNPYTPVYVPATDELVIQDDAGALYGRFFLYEGDLCVAGVERIDSEPLSSEELNRCDAWAQQLWPKD